MIPAYNDTTLTPVLISLIVATIEFAICLGCTILLWLRRNDVPDNSRRVLAAGSGFCIVSSLLKFQGIIASPTYNLYTEILSPGTCNLGLLSLLLIVAYAVTVVRPGWFTVHQISLYVWLPWIILTIAYLLITPFQRLSSIEEMVQHATDRDVLLRILTMPLTLGYAFFLLWRCLGGVDVPRWIYNYLAASLFMYLLAATFVHTNIYFFHYIHQVYVALFYLYFTHYELYRRRYVSPVIPFPADDADDMGRARFLRFDAQVDQERLFTRPDLSRDDYARLMGVDRTTFSRIIIEQSGYNNLAAYLNHKRIAYAVELMHQHPNYTLQAIMEDCGYTNKMTFNRIFKGAYGMTPSEYRKRLP